MSPIIRTLFAALLMAIGLISAHADPLPTWQNGTVAPNGDAGMLYMGAKGGFGPAFGIDLQMMSLRGDPLLLKALLAGQIDSYIGGPGSPLIAASKGADIHIVGCGWTKQSYVLWGKASISNLADMRGKTIGISTPGSAPDIFIRAALKGAGVDPESVNFVSAGMPPELLTQTAAGVIDGTATPNEYTKRGVSMGLNVITTSAKATPLSMQRCYFVNGDMLKLHPDRVARFLAAEMAAYAYSLSHRGETIALTHAVVESPANSPEPIAGYDNVIDQGIIDMSMEPPMDKLRWLRDTLAENGQINPKWDPSAMIDMGPLIEARKMFAAKGRVPPESVRAALAKSGAALTQ